jgi:hypothetical protein
MGDLFPPRTEKVSSNGHGKGDLGPIVAEYPYPGADGRDDLRVTRHDPKTFHPWHRASDGSWKMGVGGEPFPPYRLPELRAADPAEWVVVVAGEKDADRLAALGFVVTTNAGGEGKWKPEYSEHLRGRRVAIIPDNDMPGGRHAAQVARSLDDVARTARIAHLPGLSKKGDVSGWLDAGGTADELRALINDAPELGSSNDADDTEPESPTTPVRPSDRLVIRSLSTATPTETDWLWRRWLARGKFHLLGGHAGDGKGTIMAAVAAIGSVGGKWPDGTRAPRFRTLFVLGEEALDDTLRPRLDLHGADVDQGFAIETVLDGARRERFFNVERHLDLLEVALAEQWIDLLVIDPLTTVMAGSDRNAEGDTRDRLTPLIKFAERANVAVLGVAHVGKPTGTTQTLAQRILGATAFHALARVVWMTAPADHDQMALGVVESNLAMKPDALAWSREEDAPIVWHGVSTRGIGDLLSGAAVEQPRDRAEGFLRDLLRDGAKPSHEVEAAAKAEGIPWRTLRRAADVIAIKKWKERGGSGRWFWMLPDGEPRIAEPDADLAEINLATPRDTEVAKLDNMILATGAESGQHDGTAPVSGEIGRNAGTNVMEGVHVVHSHVPRGGQVASGPPGDAPKTIPADCAHLTVCAGLGGPGPKCTLYTCAVTASRVTSERRAS